MIRHQKQWYILDADLPIVCPRDWEQTGAGAGAAAKTGEPSDLSGKAAAAAAAAIAAAAVEADEEAAKLAERKKQQAKEKKVAALREKMAEASAGESCKNFEKWKFFSN